MYALVFEMLFLSCSVIKVDFKLGCGMYTDWHYGISFQYMFMQSEVTSLWNDTYCVFLHYCECSVKVHGIHVYSLIILGCLYCLDPSY